MIILLLSLALSCAMAVWIVRSARVRGQFLQDRYPGPHKFHEVPVPRVGGLAIAAGLCAGAGWVLWKDPVMGGAAWLLLVCALPAFLAGFAEDVTKAIPPAPRLLCTAVSAGLGVWLLEAVIRHTTIPGLDWVVSFPAGAVLVTAFAVTGLANAMNIIDGFNGLASMCALIILGSFGYVAFTVGDPLVLALSVMGVGAVLGFFVWNFPLGLIFMGDGGAYLLGFYVAELGILLIDRNPSVSPLFPLLVCIYPIFETLFSMYRKGVIRRMSPGVPDGVHLHMLVYKRIMRWAVGRNGGKRSMRARNSMTSPYLWIMCMLAVVPAVLFWDETAVLAGFIVLFGLTYVVLYWRIVRFRTPRFLVVSRWRDSRDADTPAR